MQAPRLYLDSAGRVWLLFRRMISLFSTWTWAVDSIATPNTANARVYWSSFATYYDGDSWLTASELPVSRDRISSTMAAAPARNGQLWTFWHTDARQDDQVHVPRGDQIWSCVLTASSLPKPYQFAPAADPQTPPAELSPASEADDVRQLRKYSVIGIRSFPPMAAAEWTDPFSISFAT